MKEQIEKRTKNSKTFHLGGNQFLCSLAAGPRHFRDKDGKFQDIDLRGRVDRGDYLLDKAPHTLRISRSRPAYRLTRSDGTISVDLVGISGNRVPNQRLAKSLLRGRTISPTERFSRQSIALDTDYEIIPKRTGVATFLTLHSEAAPRTWRWETLGDDILAPIIGHDANDYPLELEVSRGGDFLDVTWTGRIYDSKRLRRGEPSDLPPAYPVKIDPTVNEAIAVGADDCYSYSLATWAFDNAQNRMQVGYAFAAAVPSVCGFRFQTIAIPQGATINSATITLFAQSVIGSPNALIYADDVDDAPAFNGPTIDAIRNITKTTAKATIAPTATGSYSFGATGIVQEIISRTGWSSNNDIRFAGFNNAGVTASNFVDFAALEHTTNPEAQLDIVYNEGFVPRAMIY